MKNGLCTLTALAALAFVAASPLEAQEGTTVLDGVYTVEQAEAGEGDYQQYCGSCHAPSEYSGSSWVRSWSGASVGQFYSLMVSTMPLDAPAGLPPEVYANIMAYLLAESDFPAGETPLPSEADALNEIEIQPADEDGDEGR